MSLESRITAYDLIPKIIYNPETNHYQLKVEIKDFYLDNPTPPLDGAFALSLVGGKSLEEQVKSLYFSPYKVDQQLPTKSINFHKYRVTTLINFSKETNKYNVFFQYQSLPITIEVPYISKNNNDEIINLSSFNHFDKDLINMIAKINVSALYPRVKDFHRSLIEISGQILTSTKKLETLKDISNLSNQLLNELGTLAINYDNNSEYLQLMVEILEQYNKYYKSLHNILTLNNEIKALSHLEKLKSLRYYYFPVIDVNN